MPTSGLSVTPGKRKEEFTPNPVPYEEMRPGRYDPVARIVDMDRAGILASLCFPSLHALLRPDLLGGAGQGARARSASRPTTTG